MKRRTGSHGPIWNLVQECATELTRGGLVPFTRGNLIACVQRKNPKYGSDSINPVIQGVTDNLRGGAPGAVGKNILHSVGRGLFILRSGTDVPVAPIKNPTKPTALNPQSSSPKTKKQVRRPSQTDDGQSLLKLGGYDFSYIAELAPERDEDGQIKVFLPQHRYRNDGGLPLNNYGTGPFCKFKIPTRMLVSGVYAMQADHAVQYIGECQNLSDRFNMGYGNISPRNCYVGGQETNCRINNLIFEQARLGTTITLWFHETGNYKAVEGKLRNLLKPSWNRA